MVQTNRVCSKATFDAIEVHKTYEDACHDDELLPGPKPPNVRNPAWAHPFFPSLLLDI